MARLGKCIAVSTMPLESVNDDVALYTVDSYLCGLQTLFNTLLPATHLATSRVDIA